VQQQSKIDEAYWSEEFESVTTQLNQDEREKARARERETESTHKRRREISLHHQLAMTAIITCVNMTCWQREL